MSMTASSHNQNKKSQSSAKGESSARDNEKDVVYYLDKFLRQAAPVLVTSIGASIVVYVFLNESQILPYSGLNTIQPGHPNGRGISAEEDGAESSQFSGETVVVERQIITLFRNDSVDCSDGAVLYAYTGRT
ncbi:hypothetical protein AYI70_g8057 [Smittium culicis]|uniref:Uncharacterized protein n=1 Tax=Smittium culicis TaxID=133412 RepID=A0A1R1XHN9_9FUNG|nr:hypothetical protein AYI70_g8057 [Smittium culicis]